MSVHSEAWNECSYKILRIPVIGHLRCNDSAVGTTEAKVIKKIGHDNKVDEGSATQ